MQTQKNTCIDTGEEEKACSAVAQDSEEESGIFDLPGTIAKEHPPEIVCPQRNMIIVTDRIRIDSDHLLHGSHKWEKESHCSEDGREAHFEECMPLPTADEKKEGEKYHCLGFAEDRKHRKSPGEVPLPLRDGEEHGSNEERVDAIGLPPNG